MELLFISGAYRADTVKGRSQNIKRARAAAIRMWQAGYAVICPHLNTAHFDGLCDDSVWLEGDLEMLRRCDVIYMMKGWQDSEGARAELNHAMLWGTEILYEVFDEL